MYGVQLSVLKNERFGSRGSDGPVAGSECRAADLGTRIHALLRLPRHVLLGISQGGEVAFVLGVRI